MGRLLAEGRLTPDEGGLTPVEGKNRSRPRLAAPGTRGPERAPIKGGNTMAMNTDNALRRSVIYEV